MDPPERSDSIEPQAVIDHRVPDSRSRFSHLRNWMIRLATVLIGTYLFFVALLAYHENSLVYPGAPVSKGEWSPNFDFEEVQFESLDGTSLVGWYLPPPHDVSTDNCRTVLLCHGNAENVAEVSAYKAQRFRDALRAQVFVFDYRGYGKSLGSPNEAGVLSDAQAALDWLVQRTGRAPDEITLVGHSLGGGPAVHLASNNDCQAMILQRTFSSLPDAAQASYPIFPVHWIMQNRMNSAETITDCQQPLFQSHGSADRLIPIGLARKLFDNCPSVEKEFFEVEGMTHWDPLPPTYWQAVGQFMDRVAPISEN